MPRSATKRPSRTLFKQVALGVAVLLMAQYFAGYLFLWSLGVPPAHASPLTTLRYAHYYGDRAPIRRRLLLCTAAGLVVVVVTGLLFYLPKPQSLHGDARFARRSEIAAAGLLGEDGILLGELGHRYLVLPGQQGVALYAPPRSGKGVGVVLPNCLNWSGSLVTVDIKKENWMRSAGFRAAAGQACFLFDPLAPDGFTARWNPLTYVPEGPDQHAQRINDLQRIANMFYPEVPGTDPFWVASARSLFLGIALYLFETPSMARTIGEILRQGMANDDEGFGKHWKRLIKGRNSGRHPLSGECVRALCDVIDLAPPTASSVRKTFTSRLDLWLNPILDAATSESDFDLRELRRRPMSIYVGVNPDDLTRVRPVLSLFFEQVIGLQTRVLPEHDPTLKYQLQMMLDEVPALGYIPILASSIAFVPGYNVRVAMIFQAMSQLREVYGVENAKTMLASLGARIIYAPKTFEEAKEISDELGDTTVKARTRSQPRWGGFGSTRSRESNISVSDQRRPLMLAQEVKELGTDEELIFCEGLRPIRARKIVYFVDRRFRARLLPPPVAPAPGWSRPAGITSRMSPRAHATHLASEANEAAPAGRAPEEPAAAGADPVEEIAPPLEPLEPELEYTVRDATPADLERLDELTLDDFDIDVERVQIPADRNLTPGEIEAAAAQFLAALRTR
jgi:type IV secretion system protein VirD4